MREELEKLLSSKDNYLSKPYEELKEIYMNVFGNDDEENIEFLDKIDLHVVCECLGLFLSSHQGEIDIREIGMARYDNFFMITITVPCKQADTEEIIGIDEKEDMVFKIMETGEPKDYSVRVNPIFPTVASLNTLDETEGVDKRILSIHRMIEKMRSNGSNSIGKAKICKSRLRVDYNNYENQRRRAEKEQIQYFIDNANSVENYIPSSAQIIQISQLIIQTQQELSKVKRTIEKIEATHREYKLQELEDSIKIAEKLDELGTLQGKAEQYLNVKPGKTIEISTSGYCPENNVGGDSEHIVQRGSIKFYIDPDKDY